MDRPVTDEDILTFLRVNRSKYPSQIALMQAAIRLLWPRGAPTAAAYRLARLVLQDASGGPVEPSLKRETGPLTGTAPSPGTQQLPQTHPLS